VASVSRPGVSNSTALGGGTAGPQAISLAFSPTDNPAVAYENPRGKVIKLAQGTGNGQVAVSTIASVPKNTNSQPTLMFNSATGAPQVVYDDSSQDGAFVAKYHPATSQWVSKALQYGVTVAADDATVAPDNSIVYAAIADNGAPTLAVNNSASTPAGPTNVEAAAASSNQINVTWADTSQDSTEFVVQQSTDDVNFTTVAMLDPTVTKYTATNLSPDTTYYYQVSAVGSDGSQSLGIVSADATSTSFVTAASTTQPASQTPQSTITGYVYDDADDSGSYNGGGVSAPPQSDSWGGSIANLGDYLTDSGIAAQLSLTGVDVNGNAVGPLTTTSDPSTGIYTFGNLNPGTYTIKLIAPAGYIPGKENSSGIIANVVVTSGQTLSSQNFGELLPASASGYVYNDANDDGTKQAGESGISGVGIALSGTDDLGDAVSLNATTASDGSYSFTNLRPGTYTLQETAPSGYLAGKQNPTGSSGSQAVAAGGALSAMNFGEVTPASVAGFVYSDANDDGVKQSSEAGIFGVTITMTGANDLGNAVSLNTTTASSGAYSFSNLRPGTYTVTETAPGGYLAGKQNSSASMSQTIVAGGSAMVSFGELPPATFSGYVYNDANDDGVKLLSESGIAGVNIALEGTNDLGNGVSLQTTTGASGSYTFANLRPGTYNVSETAPSGYLAGIQNSSGSSGSLAVTAGALMSGVSFGEISPASVSGVVYSDANDDGTQQSGEPGISGVSVALSGTNDLGNSVALTTTTSSSGAYSFINLRPGTYSITETAPSGYIGGKQNSTGTISAIVVTQGSSVSGNSFGEVQPSSLSGYVYNDANANGIMDSGEAGISSVSVSLTGVNDLGNSVTQTATTASDGSYSFTNIRPGTYTLAAAGVAGYLIGHSTDGSESSGTSGSGMISSISLAPNVTGTGNNFAEVYAPVPSSVDTSISSGSVVVTWADPSSSVTGFIIQKSTNGGAFTTAGTVGAGIMQYTDSSVTGGNTYEYDVIATTAVGNTAASQAVTAPDLNAPSTPINLVATTASDTQINLTWDRVGTGETSLVIWRSTNGGTYQELESLPAGSNIITDPSCYPNTTYSYEVTAVNAAGSSSSSVPATATTQDSGAGLSAAASFAATAVSPFTITLSWIDNTGDNPSWLVERSTNNVYYSVVGVAGGSSTVGSECGYYDTTLSPGTTYYYRIRASGGSAYSDYTSQVSATTQARPLNTPVEATNLTATVNSATSTTLTWTDTNNDTASYLIETAAYSFYGTPSWTQVAQTAVGATSYNLATTAETFYYVRISASNASGDSGYTPQIDVRTASAGTGALTIYTIGPGEEYSSLGALNWSLLGPGDTVEIFPNRDSNGNIIPYYEKPLIDVRGTAAASINIIGMPDPTTGQLPILDGTNAVTSPQWASHYEPLEDDSLLLIGQAPGMDAGYSPGYLNVSNLELRNAYSQNFPNTYTASDGTTREYVMGCGIYIEDGDHITISGCDIHGNDEGVFGAGQGDARNLENITLDGNTIYGNGTVNSYSNHNTYIEGINTIYEYNFYGPLRSGSEGAGIKDRGAGTIIRYNDITGGGHLLDLVESENYFTTEITIPSYHSTYVYGNILYNNLDDDGTLLPIYYGGDNGVTSAYRNGVLYFYNNTFVNQANASQDYDFPIFDFPSGGETVDARNNIFLNIPETPGQSEPQMELFISGYGYGEYSVGYFGTNWISQGWGDSFGGPIEGYVAGSENFISNAENDPGFVSVTSEDFALTAGAQVLNESGVLAGNELPDLYEYVAPGTGESVSNASDLGAIQL
jgi:protocatechuate 3,4-dioxygenase beta subunit